MGEVGSVLSKEETLRQILCTIYLLACGVQDMRRRKISVRLCLWAGCAALIPEAAALLTGRGNLPAFLGGLLPGALLLLLAFAAEGAAGSGDGICYLVLGALLGAGMTWTLLMSALVLASVCGAVLMIFHKAGRKTRMPFLTFTAAAWAGILAVRLSGIDW